MSMSSSRLIDFMTDLICLLKMLTQLQSALSQHVHTDTETWSEGDVIQIYFEFELV